MAEIVEDTQGEGDIKNVTDEVTEKPKQEQQVDSSDERIPAKFRGKPVEEIIKSYTELEQAFGRKNQEVGELRQLTDKVLNLTTERLKPEPKNEETVDDEIDFFVDPKKAIERVLENHPKLKTLEQKEAQNEKLRNKQRMEQAHPDFQEVIADPEFSTWVQKSKIRQSLMAAADQNWDYDAADELFSTWKELRGRKTAQADESANQAVEEIKQRNDEALQKASVSTGSSTEAPKKLYRRADLIRLRIQDPDRYEMMEQEFLQAYAEGRVK
jgi:hypothetical protein